jgi:glutamine amidotransferase
LEFYRPVGTTDSEHAFCWLLDRVRQRFPQPPSRPQTLWRHIHKLALTLSEHGVFNFLFSDSRYLYAYCSNRLCWLTRRAPFGEARLLDAEVVVDFFKETTPRDIVTVIATRPLTDNENWVIMQPNSLVIFKHGLVVGNASGDVFAARV